MVKTSAIKQRSRSLSRACALFGGYLFAQWAVSLVVLTLAAFVVARSGESVHRVADFIFTNKVPIHSLAAILFVLLLHQLYPLTDTRLPAVFKRNFSPYHFLQGLILGLVLVVGGLLGGHFSWLGFYMHFDEIVINFASTVLFCLGLFTFVVFEEYLMRAIVEPQLRRFGSSILLYVASSAIFVGLKLFQFELTSFEILNFALLNLVFSTIARKDRSHMSSATLAATFLFTLHTLFSLPFLGQDMPGIFLLRAVEIENASGVRSLGVLLSGGTQGPENSLLLTVLLGVYLALPWMRMRIRLRHTEPAPM